MEEDIQEISGWNDHQIKILNKNINKKIKHKNKISKKNQCQGEIQIKQQRIKISNTLPLINKLLTSNSQRKLHKKNKINIKQKSYFDDRMHDKDILLGNNLSQSYNNKIIDPNSAVVKQQQSILICKKSHQMKSKTLLLNKEHKIFENSIVNNSSQHTFQFNRYEQRQKLYTSSPSPTQQQNSHLVKKRTTHHKSSQYLLLVKLQKIQKLSQLQRLKIDAKQYNSSLSKINSSIQSTTQYKYSNEIQKDKSLLLKKINKNNQLLGRNIKNKQFVVRKEKISPEEKTEEIKKMAVQARKQIHDCDGTGNEDFKKIRNEKLKEKYQKIIMNINIQRKNSCNILNSKYSKIKKAGNLRKNPQQLQISRTQQSLKRINLLSDLQIKKLKQQPNLYHNVLQPDNLHNHSNINNNSTKKWSKILKQVQNIQKNIKKIKKHSSDKNKNYKNTKSQMVFAHCVNQRDCCIDQEMMMNANKNPQAIGNNNNSNMVINPIKKSKYFQKSSPNNINDKQLIKSRLRMKQYHNQANQNHQTTYQQFYNNSNNKRSYTKNFKKTIKVNNLSEQNEQLKKENNIDIDCRNDISIAYEEFNDECLFRNNVKQK